MIWYCLIWYDTIRYDTMCDVMWCDVMWCDVMWCDVMWCDVMWCDVMWCDVKCRRASQSAIYPHYVFLFETWWLTLEFLESPFFTTHSPVSLWGFTWISVRAPNVETEVMVFISMPLSLTWPSRESITSPKRIETPIRHYFCVCIYMFVYFVSPAGGDHIYIYTHTYLEYPNKLPPDHSSKQHPTRSRWWGPCQTSAFRTWLWWRMPMGPGRMGLALARRKTHEMSRQHTKRCGKAMGEPSFAFWIIYRWWVFHMFLSVYRKLTS